MGMEEEEAMRDADPRAKTSPSYLKAPSNIIAKI